MNTTTCWVQFGVMGNFHTESPPAGPPPTVTLTHLSGQFGPMRGSMSAAELQSPASPLLKALLVALPAEPEAQSRLHSLVVA